MTPEECIEKAQAEMLCDHDPRHAVAWALIALAKLIQENSHD